MDKYVVQFSADIYTDDIGSVNEEEIADILEQHGLTVIGCQWKATWTEYGYNRGEAPISSD